MLDNISKISTDEESLLWFEKFPDFITYIKSFIIKSNHFEIFYENDNSCLFQSKLKYKHSRQWDGKTWEKWNELSYINIEIGDTNQQRFFIDKISHEQYSLKVSIEKFFQLNKVIKESFFGSKENIEKKEMFSIFYPLHIKPKEVTDSFIIGSTFSYGEEKKSIIERDVNWFISKYQNDEYVIEIDFDIFQFLIDLQKKINNFYIEFIKNENIIRKEKLGIDKKSKLTELDKDNNGEVDLVDGESFNKLLTKNQKSIVEIDKNYIQKFVKISMYLKTKKSNTQKIFDSIKDTKNDKELNELVNLLKNQIHTYELLVFHSINMITSLIDSDLITFYEIYECFDQLGVFNSNWENEVSDKLTNIGDGIRDLMYSIYQMENKIVNSIDNLTYVTQDSFKDLNISVNKQLSSIDSSIKFNNLLTGIQTYQMYRINQNTNRIN
jgi:hypothetical protein